MADQTTTFYAPPSSFRGNYVTLPEDEARHAVRVLRHRTGDEVTVVDGEGGWHRVRLDNIGKAQTSGQVVETRQGVGEMPGTLTVGLALLKNKNRFETFLEKAVELGVHRIVPLRTRRTEKKRLRRARSERLLVAALKQCGRSHLPVLAEPVPLGQALQEDESEQAILLHEAPSEGASLLDVVQRSEAERRSLWIGPEGGFADEEVEAAQEAGAQIAWLGPRRLRAETAALAAAAGVMLTHPY